MSDKSLIFNFFGKFLDNEDSKTAEKSQEADVQKSGEKPEKPIPQDSRVETVEDWNEADKKRQQRQEELLLEEAPDTDFSEEEPVVPESEVIEDKDGYAEIYVSEDKMSVSLMLQEPSGNGRPVTFDLVKAEMVQRRVVYGIDEGRIKDIIEQELYRQMFVIAKGLPAKDGEDGKIKDYFPRNPQVKYASKGNGSIDFKSMNLIHNVQKGELVCEIIMPSEPEDGIDVLGQPVHGKKGTMPPVPQGKNVVYSSDGDKLVTACEGNLTFRQGRFQVENVFTVQGNVDNAVGNIDFTGSVMIYGDVLEGYCVKSKGDITVTGIVEGAALSAAGNIILHKGMRGMKSGKLDAGGDITAKFLEDCTIYAKHDIQAEYIINSDVSCGNDMTLVGKKGAFIGGSCSVYNYMNVRSVGASSHLPTVVTLGVTPQLMEEMESLSSELILMSRKRAETEKSIAYLNGKLSEGTITDQQKDRLMKTKLEAPITVMKEKKLKQRAEEIAKQLKGVGKSRLTALEVHPGTIIYVGDCKTAITKREENCSFYYLDGEIKKGIR